MSHLLKYDTGLFTILEQEIESLYKEQNYIINQEVLSPYYEIKIEIPCLKNHKAKKLMNTYYTRKGWVWSIERDFCFFFFYLFLLLHFPLFSITLFMMVVTVWGVFFYETWVACGPPPLLPPSVPHPPSPCYCYPCITGDPPRQKGGLQVMTSSLQNDDRVAQW